MALRDEGKGARTIAKQLAAVGALNSRTGRDWTPSTVASILRRIEASA